jgi:hypothetical protein
MAPMASIQSVDQFVERLGKLTDVEYGDFKRKAGFYITELEKALGKNLTAPKKEVINRLRLLVVYNNPTDDIDTVRDQAIELARRLQA